VAAMQIVKWIGGGIFTLLFGLFVIGLYAKSAHPQVASSVPSYASSFARECRAAINDKSASKICSCMVDNMQGELQSEDEYRLAGAIIKAIIESGMDRSRMQARFDRVSQQFLRQVSIDRKAAVLKVVSREGSTCGRAHGN
jgi:hypothetical protein